MIIFSKRKRLPLTLQLTLYGKHISLFTQVISGSHLWQSPLMDPHIRNLKHFQIANYDCFRTRFLHLYKTLILPRLDYGSQLYWTTNMNVLRFLDSIQSAALRSLPNYFYPQPLRWNDHYASPLPTYKTHCQSSLISSPLFPNAFTSFSTLPNPNQPKLLLYGPRTRRHRTTWLSRSWG